MKIYIFYLYSIILIGLVLRFYNLVAVSLWHDEAFSALLIKYPWGEMMHRIAADVHPPFYYIILRFWNYIFGSSLFSLRFFSLFFGMLTVWILYVFIKKAFNSERLALIASLLVAINPFQIQFSQEARMYTLGAFLVILSSWLLLKAFEKKTYISWAIYGVVAGLALLTHYFLMFSVAAQGAFVLIWLFKKDWRQMYLIEAIKKMIVGFGVSVLVFLPYLPTFIRQFSQVQDSYWIPKMTPVSIPATLWKMISGWGYLVGSNFLWGFALVFVILFSIVLFKKSIGGQSKWFVIVSFVVPFLLAIALSFKRSLYLDRYFIFAGIFYIVIWAMLLDILIIKWKKIAYVLLIGMIISSGFFYLNNWAKTRVSDRPGMAGASLYINNNYESGQKILIGSTFVYFTFEYYNETGIRPLLISPGTYDINQMFHFSGNALLNNSDLVPKLQNKVSAGDSVWVLWTTGFGAVKPTVPENWQQTDEQWFDDVRDRGWIVITLYQIN
ncbi:MAG: hypothetical protein COU81_02200 [Candidatus Portnoybacteria bacterium CG10_big_fil_rev_8_21_14_0_10_36_7]|uniref:Glycosyltransferase RgtA/B/C/D-like domain-containing protein n=1 Tax=Candidatus Portnoybacteria bacterium CG10_big_fil_rev_8_21_14_0_10_36_7 TaxID=1974812 RepID=A0A2M8KE11_9BACT|nr:MAG: hypothetical protein COU81_02200 [Candidatus Portnoybacteria bacterium CG10_big_fil_rev_8_21_14_0_10_36_7]